jgi:CDP-4-dehydro-6-deoxyglucose reductase, E3
MSYSIRISDTQDSILFENGDNSILRCAINRGIILPHSCEDGRCGECKIKVVEGVVEARDDFGVLEPIDASNGYVLACCSVPLSDVVIEANHIPELSQIKTVNTPAKVNSFQMVTENIATLVLRLPPNNLFIYLPGQYLDLTYKGVTRSYSIANAPEAGGTLELHIRRFDGGEMSEHLFAEVPVNELMRINGPKGTFFVRNSMRPIVFIVTGTGYAPIKAMLQQLIANSDTREFQLYWGNSDPNSFYDLVWLQYLNENWANFSFIPVLRRPSPTWGGLTGAVFDFVIDQGANLRDFDFYLCGSPLMINAAKEKLIENGALEQHMFSDAFFAANFSNGRGV